MTYYNSKALNKTRESYTDFYQKATFLCLEAIDTPYSLYLLDNFKRGVVEFSAPDPSWYKSHTSYFKDAQAYALVGKNAQFKLVSDEDLEFKLVSDFFASEQRLKSVNERFSPIIVRKHPQWVDEVVNNVQKLIGNGPNWSLEEDEFFFGPGSSYAIKGQHINLLDKLERQPSISEGCKHFISFILENTTYSDHIDLDACTVVNHNYFSWVPKKFDQLRGICIENDLNVVGQKFVGNRLRKSLRRKAYDLNNQHALHKEAVRLCSLVHNSAERLPLATRDLRNASNSIARNVVKYCFPPIWHHAMNLTRSHKTQIGNLIHENELFSSMGNGFTFEMETILFLAVLMTLPHNDFLRKEGTQIVGHISVFGDDIICHEDDVALLDERLLYLGFEINHEKSFATGPFKESCGADFWDGHDVRPIYLRGNNDDENNIESVYGLANKIRRISRRIFGRCPERSRFARAYKYCRNRLPTQFWIKGPEYGAIGDGDSGLIEFKPTSWYSRHVDNSLKQGNSIQHSKFFSDAQFWDRPEGFGDKWIESDVFYYHEKCGCKFVYGYSPVMRKKHYDQGYSSETQLSYALLGGDSSGAPVRGCVIGSRYQKVYLGL